MTINEISVFVFSELRKCSQLFWDTQSHESSNHQQLFLCFVVGGNSSFCWGTSCFYCSSHTGSRVTAAGKRCSSTHIHKHSPSPSCTSLIHRFGSRSTVSDRRALCVVLELICRALSANCRRFPPTSLSSHLHNNMLLWLERVIRGEKPVSDVISDGNRIKSAWWKIESAQRGCAGVCFTNQSSYKNRIKAFKAFLTSLRGCSVQIQLQNKQKVLLFNQVGDSSPADSSINHADRSHSNTQVKTLQMSLSFLEAKIVFVPQQT